MPVENKAKIGYGYPISPYTEGGISAELAREYKNKLLGLELGLGYDYRSIPEVGSLHSIEPYAMGKAYLPWDMYVGGGIGYKNNFMNETYQGDADVDDEVAYRATLGKKIGDWLIELQGKISDLDIETGIPHETPIEKHSRADEIRLMFGRKF